MLTFIILAALALVVAVAAVAIPLLKPSATGPAPAPWAALGATAVLVLGSAVSYAALSNWRWNSAPAADSPQTMVARLARHMEQNPNDLDGWLQLGHSYVVLQEYPLAQRAFAHANDLAGGKNADALVGEAEALVLADDNQLGGRAGQLLEQALAIEPDSGKALFYGAAAAAQRGEFKLARDRFAKILDMNPPDNVKQLLQQQITALDQRLAGGGGPAADAPAAAAAPAVSGNDAPPAQAAGGPEVRVTVQLPKGAPDPSGRLFVFVRDPAAPGPPLAVKPLESHFPQTVALTPQDSPMGRGFAAGQKVQVVARVSRSGNAMAASGDPFGEVAYVVGKDGLVNITLNQVTP